MHQSVRNFVWANLRPEGIEGREILEVGAMDVNGNVSEYIKLFKPKKYIGTDIQAGQCVDVIVDGTKVHEHFGECSFDIVICLECLEHVQNWKDLVSSVKKVLRLGGALFLTTRSPGFMWHEFPFDFWRFTPELFSVIFADMRIEVLDSDRQWPGVFIKAWKPTDFKEADLSKIQAIPMVKPA